jgi:predicted alpha-1,6-mannanase (GH76 family)
METFTTVYGVTKSEGTGDGGMFKGILIRYLVQLYEVNKDNSISDYIITNAKKIESSGVAPDKGLIGPEWNKIPQPPLDVTCQLSGVFLLEAAAKIETYGTN